MSREGLTVHNKMHKKYSFETYDCQIFIMICLMARQNVMTVIFSLSNNTEAAVCVV